MPYDQVTLAELRTRLEARYEATPFWTAPEATLAINETLRTWNLLTGRWVRRVTIPTTPNSYDYALPSSLTYRSRLLFDERPLSPTSREGLNNGRVNWRQETTATGGDVPARPLLWAPVSLTYIYLWPADAAGHHSLTIDGISRTPILVADGDYVDLGQDDFSWLLGCALHLLAFKKGGAFFASTLPAWQAFLRAAGQENALIVTSVAYRRYLGLDRRDLKPLRSTAVRNTMGDLADTHARAAGGG